MTRRILLVLVTTIAFLTLYYAGNFAFLEGLFEFLITVEAVVIAELALYEILKAFEETNLTIKIHSKKGKVGFSVESNNRTIKNAYPICNEIRYQWEDDDDLICSVKDLYVGAKPSSFYPFTWTDERKVEADGHEINVIVLAEVKGTTSVWSKWDMAETLPDGTVIGLPPDVSIRIVGEGNETKRDYKISVFPFDDAGFRSELLHTSLELKKQRRKWI